MPNNFLISGAPGTGKTTVIEKVVSNLEDEGFSVGGIYCPEIRKKGRRVGFKIVDIISDSSRVMAHVEEEEGARVGNYRVNSGNIDEISELAISRALDEVDVLVIDEIAPMEVHSEKFKEKVKLALSSEKPLLAVIHKKSTMGFIGEVKYRDDFEFFDVNRETRDQLPGELTGLIMETFS